MKNLFFCFLCLTLTGCVYQMPVHSTNGDTFVPGGSSAHEMTLHTIPSIPMDDITRANATLLGQRLCFPTELSIASNRPDILHVGARNCMTALQLGEAELELTLSGMTISHRVKVVDRYGVADLAKTLPGEYGAGRRSVYGPKLNATELDNVRTTVAAFVQKIPAGLSDLEKLARALGYIHATTTYAPDWSKNRANTAWGALIYGEAQCSGYARSLKALCDAMGVPCRYVHAAPEASQPSHQWNIVQLEGQWYHVDAQLGSPVKYDPIKDEFYAVQKGSLGLIGFLLSDYMPYTGEQTGTAAVSRALVFDNGTIRMKNMQTERRGDATLVTYQAGGTSLIFTILGMP